MHSGKQAFTFLAASLCILVAFLVYQSTLGQLTDYEQLAPELARPMDEAAGAPSDPRTLRESEIAAGRGFGPDCPELHAPLILESRPKGDAAVPAQRGLGVYVYAHDYEILKDKPNQMRLHPFSMVQIQAARSGRAEEDEISTVRGQEAILEFDRPIELTKISGVRPVAGWVQGQVELKNNHRTEDPSDDFVVLTERLDYSESRKLVWTEGQIRVVQSDAQVTGVGMELELAEEAKPGTNKPRPVAKRLRLFRDVTFFLFVSEEENFLGPPPAAAKPPKPNEPADKKKGPVSPLKVTTRGPFVYDMVANRAEFQQSVRVLRQNPPKKPGDPEPIDQLECDQLVLEFEPAGSPPGQGPSKGPAGPEGSLRLRSAAATGTQVLLLSDSEQLQATGTYLFHDTKARRAILRSDNELVALQNNTVIHGRSLIIEQGEGNAIRSFVADGPNGWLEIVPDEKKDPKDRDGQRLKIRWQGRLTMSGKPGSDAQIVTITDNVELDDERGAMKCDELKVWLVPVGDGPGGPPSRGRRVEPVKLEAMRNVSAKFENLVVVTDNLMMDVVHLKERPTAGGAAAKEAENPSESKAPPPAAEARRPPVLKTAQARTERKVDDEPLDVRAKRVAVVVEREGSTSRPIKAWAEGDVLVSQPSVRPDQQPVEIRGQTLDFNRTPEGDVLKVGGGEQRLAFIHTPELTLAGRRFVRLDEVANAVDVSGSGYLLRTSENDLTGKKADKPQVLRVDWDKQMHFDGKLASFAGGVKAQQGTAEIHCQNMDVAFDVKVDFREIRRSKDRRKKSPAKIESIDCDKDVIVYDGERKDGLFVRHVTTRAPELHYDNLFRVAEAKGPGQVQIIEKGQSRLDAAGRPAPPKANFQLTTVRFQGAMRADQASQNIKFFDQVHIVHSPVDRLDEAIDENRLHPDGMILDALDHAIIAMIEKEDGKKYRDFQASGNVKVQSRDYWGQGDQISYDQQKDLLVFSGSAAQKALFFRQTSPGERPEEYPARTIRYWRSLNRIVTDSAEGFNATFTSQPSSSPPPPKR